MVRRNRTNFRLSYFKMKTKLYFFLLGCLLYFPTHAQKGVKESMRLATPPVIDGNVDEWQTDWLLDSKSKFLYNVANDNDNLYIRLKISDAVLQQKVALFGLTLYFNPEGGSKKGKLGLQYPIKKDMDEMKNEQSGASEKEKSWVELKKTLIRDAELLELIGLDKDPILSPRVGLMNGIGVTIAVDLYNDLVYEAKIPFKAYRIDKSKVENFGLVIETGRLVIKQPLTTGKATYYRGVRYAAPTSSMPQNEYTSSTTLRLNLKLN